MWAILKNHETLPTLLMVEEVAPQSQSVKISVKYLGFIREMTGTKEDNFDLPKPVYVQDVLSRAAVIHPRLGKVVTNIRATVNGTMTTENVELQNGDALSFMASIVGG